MPTSRRERLIDVDWLVKRCTHVAARQYGVTMAIRLSTALSANVAGGDFVLVGGEGCQDFGLLRFGTLKKSSVRPSSAATSSNSAGEILRSRWASSRPSGVEPGLVAVNWKGPPETSQTHSVRMNLRPEPFQVLGVPFSQLRVLGLLSDNGVLHDSVAEVIHHGCDSKDTAQPFVETFVRLGVPWLGRKHDPAPPERAGRRSAQALRPRLVL